MPLRRKGLTAIAGLEEYYQQNHPDYYSNNSEAIKAGIAEIQNIYETTVFHGSESRLDHSPEQSWTSQFARLFPLPRRQAFESGPGSRPSGMQPVPLDPQSRRRAGLCRPTSRSAAVPNRNRTSIRTGSACTTRCSTAPAPAVTPPKTPAQRPTPPSAPIAPAMAVSTPMLDSMRPKLREILKDQLPPPAPDPDPGAHACCRTRSGLRRQCRASFCHLHYLPQFDLAYRRTRPWLLRWADEKAERADRWSFPAIQPAACWCRFRAASILPIGILQNLL